MMRSLWTAASGMISQQTNVDTISNNLSNINTTGYKKESMEFKSLLYQTIQEKSTDSQGNAKPVGVQVGLGVKNAAITSQFTQGSLNATGNTFDFAIEGSGFFMVQKGDGTTAYTRNGSFQMSIGVNGTTLCDSDGNPVLDVQGVPIVVDPTLNTADLTIDESGSLLYPDAAGNPQPIGMQIGLAQFSNPAGLEKASGTLLNETEASGVSMLESQSNVKKSKLIQGSLEASNVQAVDEMVNLIVAQRAYEMNSKAITASDTMLQQANNLRG